MGKNNDSGFLSEVKALIIKFFEHETLSYLFFGVLTTLLSFAVYEIYYYVVPSPTALAANTVASVVGVIFAFVTNKLWVFSARSSEKKKEPVGVALASKKTTAEFFKFVTGRIFTFGLETGILFVTVDLLKYDKTLLKIISTVIVVVLNYFISKLVVFNKR